MNVFHSCFQSLVGYLRSVYVMKDKSIFDVKNIDAAAVANSYGLMSAPRVRFLSKKGIVLTVSFPSL